MLEKSDGINHQQNHQIFVNLQAGTKFVQVDGNNHQGSHQMFP